MIQNPGAISANSSNSNAQLPRWKKIATATISAGTTIPISASSGIALTIYDNPLGSEIQETWIRVSGTLACTSSSYSVRLKIGGVYFGPSPFTNVGSTWSTVSNFDQHVYPLNWENSAGYVGAIYDFAGYNKNGVSDTVVENMGVELTTGFNPDNQFFSNSVIVAMSNPVNVSNDVSIFCIRTDEITNNPLL